jgi:hypothetical protein
MFVWITIEKAPERNTHLKKKEKTKDNHKLIDFVLYQITL